MGSMAESPAHGDVLDIGGSVMQADLAERLIRALKARSSPHIVPPLPDELLYDDIGLPIWNDIISSPEFYQTHDEIALLEGHGRDIVARLEPGVTIIDLGAGDTRKVEHLLAAFEHARVPATYLALDISHASLTNNVAYLVDRHSESGSVVRCAGLWGTFRDGKDYVERIKGPRLFLSLGSVLCNDPWPDALGHLKSWAGSMREGDLLLIGMDGHKAADDYDKIWAAYHTREDLYRRFFLNGFAHVNKLVGQEWLREQDWMFGANLEREPSTRHRFFLRARRQVELAGLDRIIAEGQEFDWFDSHKYDEMSVRLMCSKAGLGVLDFWKLPESDFNQYLLGPKDGCHEEDVDSAVSGL